ncbi:NAD(P)H-binding protein [Acidothermaceae bacterium B102]|nr:NAD(P)H-binding protein [Acidothermaceae bacterium B102]
MQITILGATGKTGTALVTQALAAGHRVTALVRTPDTLTIADPAMTVVTGDARVTDDVAKALAGADAVISTLGSMKSKDELLARATKAIVGAAQDAGVRRVVVLSSFLAAPTYKANLLGKLVGGMLKGMVADKAAGEATLTRSGLDWTIVYATGLDKAKPGIPVRVLSPTETVSMSNGIARADVATFLLAEVTGAGHPRATVVITGT